MVTQVLAIVYRAISAHLIHKADLTRASAVSGAVTLIHRFGSALNLNIHFHMLLLDGVYVGVRDSRGQPRFQRVKAPDRAELEQLVYAISERTGRYLERQGLLVRDLDNSYLALEPDLSTIAELRSASHASSPSTRALPWSLAKVRRRCTISTSKTS